MKSAIVWLVALVVVGAGGYFGYRWYASHEASPMAYRTQPVRRMDIAQTIAATGTVVPEDVIDVGAQVNGQIAEFGKDKQGKTIDYRSEVEEGTVLAKIDDSLYAADLASANAQKASAQSQVSQADAQIQTGEATKQLATAKQEQARRDWERAQKLINTTALARADYDAAESAFEQAGASVGVAEASIAEARASKAQAEAMVQQADALVERTGRNVAYCVIKAPVGGTVIDKRVEIGQTVVASLNAPSLFLLAKDLSKMEVLVQVNEADIGSVHAGQPVSFNVDAFPGRKFAGEVRKVRLNATMTQNVVTYTVEIATDNKDLTLLPYLTANVKFDVAHRTGVLAVPNAALRWTPSGAESAEPPAHEGKGGEAKGTGMRPGMVWTLKDGRAQSVAVRAGLSDGVNTEIEGEGVTEGMEVIVGEQSADVAPSAGTNPFAPNFRRNRSSGGASGAAGTHPAGGSGAGGAGAGGAGKGGTGTGGTGGGAGTRGGGGG